MFSKRKKTDPKLIHIESADRRASYRVCPRKDFPVHISVDGRSNEIVDIGGGGVAFRNIDFEEGRQYKAIIRLPGHEDVICADIYIINIDPEGICHCNFQNIRDQDTEAIHKYMLEVQKEEIREKKSCTSN